MTSEKLQRSQLSPKEQLTAAKFTFSAITWAVNRDGDVIAVARPQSMKKPITTNELDQQDPISFDLYNASSRAAAQRKLHDRGWRFKPITRAGKSAFGATHKNSLFYEDASLERLVYRCVEQEQKND
jgi:hypothetical protein